MVSSKVTVLCSLLMMFALISNGAEYRTLEDATQAAEVVIGEKYTTPLAKESATKKLAQIVNDATLSEEQKVAKVNEFIRVRKGVEKVNSASSVPKDQKSNDLPDDKIMQKLKNIVNPSLEFEGADIYTAVRYLNKVSKKLDPTGEGIVFYMRVAPEKVDKNALLTLSLNNRTLGECLFFICAAANLEFRIEEDGVGICTPEDPSYDIIKDERYASDDKLKQTNTQTNIKLEDIIFPLGDFEDCSVSTAIKYVEEIARSRSAPNQKCISFVFKFSEATATTLPKITKRFTKIPMSDLVPKICENSCLKYVICKEVIIFSVDWGRLVKWYRKKAEKGDPDAQCNLGMCYAKGYGVNKDIAEATKWYRQAAQKGNEKAKLAIKQLE